MKHCGAKRTPKGIHLFCFLLIALMALVSCSDATGTGNTSKMVLKDIQAHFQARTDGSQSKTEFRGYLTDKLKNFGYEVTKQNFTCTIERQGKADQEEPYESTGVNLIAKKQGTTDKTVVVGAHYDSGFTMDPAGNNTSTCGVDDNGSGVATLLEVAEWAAGQTLPYTVVFALFDQEETGRSGSDYYVTQLSAEDLSAISFMVNIDSVAAGDYCYIYGGKIERVITEFGPVNQLIQTQVVYNAKSLADIMGLSVHLQPGRYYESTPTPYGTGSSDNFSFMEHDVPYIYFEATNWTLDPMMGTKQTEELGQIMHTRNDDLDVIVSHFGDRPYEHMRMYVRLLEAILLKADKMNDPM